MDTNDPIVAVLPKAKKVSASSMCLHISHPAINSDEMTLTGNFPVWLGQLAPRMTMSPDFV